MLAGPDGGSCHRHGKHQNEGPEVSPRSVRLSAGCRPKLASYRRVGPWGEESDRPASLRAKGCLPVDAAM